MISQTGLELLMFGHRDAREDPLEEVERLRTLEKKQSAPDNFVLYLRKKPVLNSGRHDEGTIRLNPCLVSSVGRLSLRPLRILPRIGVANPLLSGRDRRFLRQFVTPVRSCDIPDSDAQRVALYKRLLFLVG
jgi:hypothetical protein